MFGIATKERFQSSGCGRPLCDQFDVPSTVGDRIDDQPTIKRRERAAMRTREQIGMGHLICRKDPARIDVLWIEQAYVVSPDRGWDVLAIAPRAVRQRPASRVCSGNADCR